MPTRDLEDEEEKSGALIEKYSKEDEFLPAHKYVAIVQADGDYVGKSIGKLHPTQYQDFSKVLTEFSIDAVRKINSYGGLPVYAGGDDLLFFAPVLNQHSQVGPKNIFSLLVELDKEFQKKITQLGIIYSAQIPQPTLSFGLSISYYKFPLYESLSNAQHLLFANAKNTDLNPGKNAIVWEVRKHSGSTFRANISLGGATNIKKEFNDLLKRLSDKNNDRVLASVAHKLRNERDPC